MQTVPKGQSASTEQEPNRQKVVKNVGQVTGASQSVLSLQTLSSLEHALAQFSMGLGLGTVVDANTAVCMCRKIAKMYKNLYIFILFRLWCTVVYRLELNINREYDL